MATRVSTGGATGVFIQRLFEQRLNLENLRNQIATGVKVAYGSDDTGKAGTIVALQNLITRIDRHKERISSGKAILSHQESTIESADNLLVRAKEIATQGANGTLSFENRALLADEVWQLRDQMVSLANTTYQGRYIYGAADDDDPPFDAQTYTVPPTGAQQANARWVFDAEDGTSQTRAIYVNDTDQVRINSRGDVVFNRAIGALERLGRALDGYRTTLDPVTGLPDGGGTAYNLPTDYAEQTNDILTSLDAIDVARTYDLTVERTDIGSRISRMEQVEQILDNLKIASDTNRAAIQDADIFDVSAKFTNLQSSLQALLASGAQINQLSLLNFL